MVVKVDCGLTGEETGSTLARLFYGVGLFRAADQIR